MNIYFRIDDVFFEQFLRNFERVGLAGLRSGNFVFNNVGRMMSLMRLDDELGQHLVFYWIEFVFDDAQNIKT